MTNTDEIMFWIALIFLIVLPFIIVYYILKGIWFIVDELCYDTKNAVLLFLLIIAAIVVTIVYLVG